MKRTIVAVTGTPGTGKSAVGSELSKLGETVLDLSKYLREHAPELLTERDEERSTAVVDEGELRKTMRPVLREQVATLYIEGHLSHHLAPLDVVVVLRCRPSELSKRLSARGWPAEKVAENVEAEAVDAIVIEVAEMRTRELLVAEFDTTGRTASDVASEIQTLVRDPTPEALNARRLGTCDWSDEVMSWY